MSDAAIPVSIIITTGLFLTVVAWQILGMVREHAARDDEPQDAVVNDLRRRVEQLEQAR